MVIPFSITAHFACLVVLMHVNLLPYFITSLPPHLLSLVKSCPDFVSGGDRMIFCSLTFLSAA
jgi:hypothetical protein